jgi:hypothetical protein
MAASAWRYPRQPHFFLPIRPTGSVSQNQPDTVGEFLKPGFLRRIQSRQIREFRPFRIIRQQYRDTRKNRSKDGVSANHVHGFGRFNLQNVEAGPEVTQERLVTFDTALLFERPAEVGQDPQGQQIDAEERLDPRHRPHPAGGAQGILAGLHAGDPGADVQLTPAEGKS